MLPSLAVINNALHASFPELELYLYESLDSTSTFLKSQEVIPSLCYCRQQSAGYGQRAANWQSGHEDLTFSLLLPFKVALHELDGLPQLIGVKVVECLNAFYALDAQLKWPNDVVKAVTSDSGEVLCKLGGLLVEVRKYQSDGCWLIVGIGLNAQNDSQQLPIEMNNPDKPALLKSGCGFNDYDQEHNLAFFSVLIGELCELAEVFAPGFFSQQVDAFKKLDYFSVGQELFVYDTGTRKKGVYQGIDASGELLVSIDGLLTRYRSGSVSIRPCESYE
ncbi:biotin--[acetyl-CoA-carboxylase] ligase [Thiomicrorhabdus xiamenensis]|uniref:Biotin--[acetyl-CoA-carboxylase] ligase n=1 Tax=Thiomicrorhabdus xiamenensis TaxID=2739063 RepID=A0A7D4T978_9GAMM|nr:biotin--[acetyl-CoA-carboxylase] ligase [Thiomicrorhabdus xiamenensis]QKI88346.1 biotin--[acetyl-CoA-carboxylase] ligase [Thiomicrorhabdus xiamenensis]